MNACKNCTRSHICKQGRNCHLNRPWQDERDEELDAPDTYPEPEPESNYTPDQS